MNNPFIPSAGGVLSADIAVPEHEREVQFYARVLTTGEDPLWREDLMNNLGMPIIGLGMQSAEYAHLPLQWMPHIQVVDVAATVERAVGSGGSVLLHGKDDDGKSLWAGLLDPDGAAFGIIPVVSAEEYPPKDIDTSSEASAHAGHISRLTLSIPDAAAARTFYHEVIGWSTQEVEKEDESDRYTDYDLFDDAGNPVGEICHARGINRDLPSVWLLSLPVGDLAESLRRVEEGGGKILKTTQGNGGEQASAVIQDPVGARLALVSAT